MKNSSRGGAAVRLVAIHTTEGIMRATDLQKWASWPGSSHAATDELGTLLDGAAGGFVDYDRSAWTLRSGNPISDNLEQCAWARWTREDWLARPRLLEATAEWIARRCRARGIPCVHLTLSQLKAGHYGVIAHWDWTLAMGDGTHTDVGKFFPWDVVLGRALQKLTGSAGGVKTEGFLMALNDTEQATLYNAVIRQLGGEALPIAVGSDLIGGPVATITGGPQQARAVHADTFANVRALRTEVATLDQKLDAVLTALQVKVPERAMKVSSTRGGPLSLEGTVTPVPAPLENAEVLEDDAEVAARLAELQAIADEDDRRQP